MVTHYSPFISKIDGAGDMVTTSGFSLQANCYHASLEVLLARVEKKQKPMVWLAKLKLALLLHVS